MKKNKIIIKQNQKGAVLMVGLMILLVLTIIAISAFNFTAISEKLTGNQRDKDISFQAAEAALSDGEAWLKSQTTIPKSATDCKPAACNVFSAKTFSSFQTQTLSWWSTYGQVYSSAINQVDSQPHFVIEEYSFIPYDLSPESRSKGLGYYYYKVTAQGTGTTDNSKSVVQSIYATQYN